MPSENRVLLMAFVALALGFRDPLGEREKGKEDHKERERERLKVRLLVDHDVSCLLSWTWNGSPSNKPAILLALVVAQQDYRTHFIKIVCRSTNAAKHDSINFNEVNTIEVRFSKIEDLRSSLRSSTKTCSEAGLRWSTQLNNCLSLCTLMHSSLCSSIDGRF